MCLFPLLSKINVFEELYGISCCCYYLCPVQLFPDFPASVHLQFLKLTLENQQHRPVCNTEVRPLSFVQFCTVYRFLYTVYTKLSLCLTCVNNVKLPKAVLQEHEQQPDLKQECSAVEKCVTSAKLHTAGVFGSQLALVLLSSKRHCRQAILVGEYAVGYIKKTLLWFY